MKTAVEVGGEQRWIYAAIDVNSKLLLDLGLPSRLALMLPQHSSTESNNTTLSKTKYLSYLIGHLAVSHVPD